jgi:hypothetical protein
METLDWTPEASDPDDCTDSVRDLYSVEHLLNCLIEVQRYLDYCQLENKPSALPLPYEEERFISDHHVRVIFNTSLESPGVIGARNARRVMDTLSRCLDIIRIDKSWLAFRRHNSVSVYGNTPELAFEVPMLCATNYRRQSI